MANLLAISYQSTNYYLLECTGGRLLVDAGWAGTMPVFRNRLKTAGVELAEIRWVLATHFHPDHAGLFQDIKQAAGARAVFHAAQLPFAASFGQYFKGKVPYTPIQVASTDLVLEGSPAPLPESTGLPGQVILTPGHSDDSISLVLQSGEAFTGDLPLPDMVMEDQLPVVVSSWKSLLAYGARVFYPAHAASFLAEELLRRLHLVE